MRRLFAGAVCLLALCGCDSAPQNPVDAAIVSPATPRPRRQPRRPASRTRARASGPCSFLLRRDLRRRSISTPIVA